MCTAFALPSDGHVKRRYFCRRTRARRTAPRGGARKAGSGDRSGRTRNSGRAEARTRPCAGSSRVSASTSAFHANPFGNLTREQRLARLEALAKLLDVAFILPGTNIRYGIDGLIGLIPVVGDLITTAISLWLVREARALGAPWHITARMLGQRRADGVVGMVPLAGDAFDVMFRANMRNVRILKRWMDKQPRLVTAKLPLNKICPRTRSEGKSA